MIRSFVKCIDWEWIGISYMIAIFFFGLAALIKWDFDVLINGILFFSFFVILGCLNILAVTVKNNYR